jgi:hypothetical protein
MTSTENWWPGEIDWTTPAGQLLQKFLATLPADRFFHFTLYGSAPLQLTVDRQLMSGDVDLFSDDDEDLSSLVVAAKLDKTHGGFYLEPGFELCFRTIHLTGHPTAAELKQELQNAVDLFRPAFDDEALNRYPENTSKLWQEIFGTKIDVRREIIEPAVEKRKQGYGETPPDYKSALGQ